MLLPSTLLFHCSHQISVKVLLVTFSRCLLHSSFSSVPTCVTLKHFSFHYCIWYITSFRIWQLVNQSGIYRCFKIKNSILRIKQHMQKPSRHFWGPGHSRTSSSLWLFTQPAGPGPRDIGATPWVLFSLMQMHSSQKAFIHSSQNPTFSSQFHCTATRFSMWVTGDSALGVSRLQNEGFGHDQLYAYSTCEMLLFFWDLKLIDIFLILSLKVHHEKPRIIEGIQTSFGYDCCSSHFKEIWDNLNIL